VFAYDGSDLADLAIEEAGRLIGSSGRDAVVLTVWQPFDVGFVAADKLKLDAAQIVEVEQAAKATAAAGQALAEAAGFRATSAAVQAAPTWKGIAEFAEECDASLIVFGSHGRSGVFGHLFGRVSFALAGHTQRSVLIVHERP
jgi:nucleotide-binding universal stress UspA family protein